MSEKYAARRRALISEQALTPEAGDPSCGGTIYLCTADPQGNMVSFIQSNYTTFGAGVAIPGPASPSRTGGPTSLWTREATTAWPGVSGPITPSSPGS